MPFAGWILRAKGFSPPTPQMTHGASSGQFVITAPSYIPYATYTSTSQTLGAGSPVGTVTGNTVALGTSGTVEAYVTGSVGLKSPASTYITRTPYTYNTSYFVQTGFYTYNGPCGFFYGPNGPCYGTCGPGTQNCGVVQGYYACCVKDPTPPNYQDGYSEWYRVING